MNNQIYTGNSLTKTIHLLGKDGRTKILSAYLPTPDLVQVINEAILLRRPLLITGERGNGKTLVASAIAYEFYREEYFDFYFEWNIQKKANFNKEVYCFEKKRYLYDSKISYFQRKVDFIDPSNYIRLSPLFQGMLKSKTEKRAIVLITGLNSINFNTFFDEFLDFFNCNEIEFKEIDKKYTFFDRPLVIFTYDNEIDLLDNHKGQILKFSIPSATPEQLFDRIMSMYNNFDYEVLKKIIELYQTLKYHSEFSGIEPLAITELYNLVQITKNKLETGMNSKQELLEQFDIRLKEQEKINKDDLRPNIQKIISLLEKAETDKAFEKLKTLSIGYSKDDEVLNDFSLFNSRYSILVKAERLKTEHYSFLQADKNKLIFNVIDYLRELFKKAH